MRHDLALLGVEVELETLDGPRAVEVPRGTQPGTLLRLRGLGAPRPEGRSRGDLVIEVVVEVPTDLSREDEELLRQFAHQRGDEVAARRLIEAGRPLNRRGAEIIRELLRGAACPHPVAVALLLRFFRRIQSHLIHIAQAVVIPAGRLESRRHERRP